MDHPLYELVDVAAVKKTLDALYAAAGYSCLVADALGDVVAQAGEPELLGRLARLMRSLKSASSSDIAFCSAHVLAGGEAAGRVAAGIASTEKRSEAPHREQAPPADEEHLGACVEMLRILMEALCEAGLGRLRDVAESRQKDSETTYLSYHDTLTGLYNRAFLQEEEKRLDTARQLPISVIMGDVNGLKLTNDLFGHAEGDALLVRIAGILSECCRDEDIVARVGGDEFFILLPQTSGEAALDICRRIYARCQKEEGGLQGSAKVSISLGCATKADASQSLQDATKAAEEGMYRRKLLESRSQHSLLISSIRKTLFEKSFETEQHTQRLITSCKAVAEALNLPDDQLNDIELFALLHDIGKIAIDSHILTKPGPLDAQEWAEMRKHPEIGYRIAQASMDLAHIADFILCHHERWDGSGYPQGLKGTAIPLLARIMLVVDAYDAMTHGSVYRKTMSPQAAGEELMKNAGTQFDPNVLWVFMEWLDHQHPSA
jgi:diguanylate cyclase (GGDEF)-like protein